MPPRGERVAGITALVASLLLGSCGTGGKGERVQQPGQFFWLKGQRGIYWSTRMLLAAKLTYLINGREAGFLFCGRKEAEFIM